MSIGFGASVEFKNYGDYRAVCFHLSLLPLFALEIDLSKRARIIKFMPWGKLAIAKYYYL